ncbi:MAG: PDZ domain-containing protein [Bryobacteraceae bacterium]
MRKLFILVCLAVPAAFAQLTTGQKLADFNFLAGLYAKQYAPYEWKRTLFGFDALNIGPWLDRAAKTKDDLDFYELCIEYVASLQDSHDSFSLRSDFVASLGLSVDIYDGKVLIDSIGRTRLPLAAYPFVIGDELVSVDGIPAGQLIDAFSKYAIQSNSRSTRRMAAARIVTRPQSRMPHAVDLGETAAVEIRRANDALEAYTIPWLKAGTPLSVGPVLFPKAAQVRDAGADETPDFMRDWYELQYSGTNEPYGVLNVGARAPIFAMPADFVQRQGRAASDFFFSGTYTAEGLRIGFIRVPNYGTLSAVVLAEFEREIAFFQDNTDGLVVDDMRNPGGLLCFGENVVARLTPYNFRPTGYLLRATWSRVNSFYASLNAARNQNAEKWMIDMWTTLFNDISTAYREQRGLSRDRCRFAVRAWSGARRRTARAR